MRIPNPDEKEVTFEIGRTYLRNLTGKKVIALEPICAELPVTWRCYLLGTQTLIELNPHEVSEVP